jgi:hypothetical protein
MRQGRDIRLAKIVDRLDSRPVPAQELRGLARKGAEGSARLLTGHGGRGNLQGIARFNEVGGDNSRFHGHFLALTARLYGGSSTKKSLCHHMSLPATNFVEAGMSAQGCAEVFSFE